MAGNTAEEHVRTPWLYQSWRDVTFLHWRYDPATIAAFVPPDLRIDLWEGAAWVSLTPLRIEGMRPPLLPPLPGLSSFPETNLRTYVIGPNGLDGLLFFTLEAASRVTAVAARTAFSLPYRAAEMTVDRQGGRITYRSHRRRDAGKVGHRIEVEPGDVLEAGEVGPLDHWLTGRWRAWTSRPRQWTDVPVEHPPWRLHRARVVTLEETLLAHVGLPPPDRPPLVHFSPGVDVRFGPPRLHP